MIDGGEMCARCGVDARPAWPPGLGPAGAAPVLPRCPAPGVARRGRQHWGAQLFVTDSCVLNQTRCRVKGTWAEPPPAPSDPGDFLSQCSIVQGFIFGSEGESGRTGLRALLPGQKGQRSKPQLMSQLCFSKRPHFAFFTQTWPLRPLLQECVSSPQMLGVGFLAGGQPGLQGPLSEQKSWNLLPLHLHPVQLHPMAGLFACSPECTAPWLVFHTSRECAFGSAEAKGPPRAGA